MKILGFNFNKISIERTGEGFKDLKIESKINIESINTIKADMLKEKDEVVKIEFTYEVDYSPKIAKIDLRGQILMSMPKEQASELIEGWKKKKIKEDYRLAIFNLILRKANIKSLELEEDMNLPPHIPFPTLKKQQKE